MGVHHDRGDHRSDRAGLPVAVVVNRYFGRVQIGVARRAGGPDKGALLTIALDKGGRRMVGHFFGDLDIGPCLRRHHYRGDLGLGLVAR